MDDSLDNDDDDDDDDSAHVVLRHIKRKSTQAQQQRNSNHALGGTNGTNKSISGAYLSATSGSNDLHRHNKRGSDNSTTNNNANSNTSTTNNAHGASIAHRTHNNGANIVQKALLHRTSHSNNHSWIKNHADSHDVESANLNTKADANPTTTSSAAKTTLFTLKLDPVTTHSDHAETQLQPQLQQLQQQPQVQTETVFSSTPPSSASDAVQETDEEEVQRIARDLLERRKAAGDVSRGGYLQVQEVQRLRHHLQQVAMKDEAFVLRVLLCVDTLLEEEDEEGKKEAETNRNLRSPSHSDSTTNSNNAPADNKDSSKDSPDDKKGVWIQMASADAVLAKYARMLKMGVPAASVVAKMTLDGVEASSVRATQIALCLIEDDSQSDSSQSNKSKKNKLIQLSDERLLKSVWAFASTSDAAASKSHAPSISSGTTSAEEDMAESELKALEELFSKAHAESSSCDSNNNTKAARIVQLQAQAKQSFALQILEPKRAQNIAIGLAAFKNLLNNNVSNHANNRDSSKDTSSTNSHQQIVRVLKAVCALDDLDHTLDADHLDNLQALLPTQAEAKKQHLLTLPRHPAETFCAAALLFYPELPLRLNTFSLCLAYPQQCRDTLQRLSAVVSACHILLSSHHLAHLLQRLLVVSQKAAEHSNHLSKHGANHSNNTNNSNADKPPTVLSQLLSACQRKALDRKTSVLQVAIKGLYAHSSGEGVLHVAGALQDLQIVDDVHVRGGGEALQDCLALDALVKRLQDELHRHQQHTANVFASPTANKLSDEYSTRLTHHVQQLQTHMVDVNKARKRLQQKTQLLLEYFGEDPSQSNGLTMLLSSLRDLKRDVGIARDQVEWHLTRQQQQALQD